MSSVEQFEREKYQAIWGRGDYTSSTAISFAESLKGKVGGYVLEIGCGSGVSMDILNRERGVKCSGVDITLVGNKSTGPVFEAVAWSLPFPDKSFDYSFSTDTMEHIPPEFIEATLKEIDRVTRHKTFHYIACCEAVTEYLGSQVHLTVEPGTWWNKQFIEFCKIESELKFWGTHANR